MNNNDFQDRVMPGDILITEAGSVRHRSGIKYKFLGFSYCKNGGSSFCKGCKGLIKFEQSDSWWNGKDGKDCMREYNDGDTGDYLVIKVDIFEGSNWLDDGDWEF